MKIAISLDSACDASKEVIEEYGFNIVPFGVTMGDRFFYDGEVDTLEIFEYADKSKTLPKTNAVNEDAFDKHFAKLLENNDAVIHFDISSDMSSAYNNAVNSAKKFKNVYVIDSRTLSTGISLEAIYAKKLADKGVAPEVIVEKVKERIPYVQASFVIERLDCRATLEKYNNPDKSVIFITHSRATQDMVDAAKAVVKEYGFEKVYETYAGCTVSSHCGKNTLGILYINDGKAE